MASEFVEVSGYIRDVGIVNKMAVVAIDHQEPHVLGKIDKIIFNQDWQVTFICTSLNKKKIFSMGINHKLYKKLQLIANLSEVLQSHTKDYDI